MTRYIKHTRTLKEARAFLSERYDYQCVLFPTLRRVSKALYIRRNERSARTYYALADTNTKGGHTMSTPKQVSNQLIRTFFMSEIDGGTLANLIDLEECINGAELVDAVSDFYYACKKEGIL